MIVILILSILLLCGAIALVFKPMLPSTLLSWPGLLLLSITPWGEAITAPQLWFWGIAALLAVGIWYMLPRAIVTSSTGMGFVGGGALAGALVGVMAGMAGMIVGAAAGAFFGALAFSRTKRGAPLQFPSKRFLNWLCAMGLPAVVTMCIVGISLVCIIYS